MYLKHFRGETVRDTLRAVRDALGPQALVLSTKMVPARGWRGVIGDREVEITAAAERESSAPRREVSADRHQTSDGGAADVAARLAAVGLNRVMADEVAALMPAAARRGASIGDLRAALTTRLSALTASDATYAPVEIFVGPPGVGKTTTIAKIAAQERALAGRRLGLLAADSFRIGAVEQLRIYADIIGSPFHIARTPEDLDRALGSSKRQPVLVDTAGRSPGDDAMRGLFRTIAGRPDVRTHLVLPAGTSPAAAKRIFDLYEDARPSRVVLTKVDEADSMGPLLGVLGERDLPISYVGSGQRVPDDLKRATAQLLAASVIGESVPRVGVQS